MFAIGPSPDELRRRRRRLRALAFSVVVHGAALAAFIGVSFFRVPAVAEPVINTEPLSIVIPVRLPDPERPATTPPTRAHADAPAPHTLVQPPTVPETLPQNPPTVPSSEVVTPHLDTGGDQDISVPGPDNGLPPGVGGGHDISGTDSGPLHLTARIVKPELIPGTRVEPLYTDRARQVRLEGLVVLSAVIDKTGKVIDLQALRGLPLGLTESAIAAVRQWRFHPATLDGRPVDVFFTVTVQFTTR